MREPALSNCQKLRSDRPFCEKCSTIDIDIAINNRKRAFAVYQIVFISDAESLN